METSGTVYADIARRTDGDIYIGVVGPVRTGKSTFIKKFMETLVLPNIPGEFRRARATDEMPQSAAGKTIMTTEPKFVPEEAVAVKLGDNAEFRVRMIDCVGYIVPSAIGYFENDAPRMVMTPWFPDAVPFNMAAEVGTHKVITDHSTIGLVVTSDGSISDIPRDEYAEAEERVISELREISKPFVVLLNCVYPKAPDSKALRTQLEEKYGVPVIAVNCLDLDEDDIKGILESVLFEFPIKEIAVNIPRWVLGLERGHWLRGAVMDAVTGAAKDLTRIREVAKRLPEAAGCEYVDSVAVRGIDLGSGRAEVTVALKPDLFYKILGEATGLEIDGESGLLPCMVELAAIKKKYERIRGALDQVEAVGYGIVMPSMEELTLEEPEIVKQGGKYGVRLKASAPSVHMLRANITTEVNPIVGSEKQSEELVMYMMKEFEEDPQKIWESNIFGKSLHELVNEGLHNKLYRMPQEARMKLQETVERIINEGCSGLVCVIL